MEEVCKPVFHGQIPILGAASYGPLSTASLTEVAIDRREMAFPLGHMWFCVPAILPAEKDYFWPLPGTPGRASARARGVILCAGGEGSRRSAESILIADE